jgi:hypothetical protein
MSLPILSVGHCRTRPLFGIDVHCCESGHTPGFIPDVTAVVDNDLRQLKTRCGCDNRTFSGIGRFCRRSHVVDSASCRDCSVSDRHLCGALHGSLTSNVRTDTCLLGIASSPHSPTHHCFLM